MNELAWLTAAVERTATHVGRPEDCASVQWNISGAPSEPSDITWRVDGGRVVAVGGVSEPECVLTLPYEAAVAVANHETDPAALFTQGVCKTSGDAGAVLRVLPAAVASARA